MTHKKLMIMALNLVFLIFLFLFSAFKWHQEDHAPDSPSISQKTEIPATYPKNYLLAGTEKGLFYWDFQKTPALIFEAGEVKKMVETSEGLYLLTSEGIFFTRDLKEFQTRNEGLTRKVVKHYQQGKKTFTRDIQDLKDLKADPENPKNLITATKDGVFYSTDAGLSWKFLKNPTTTTGIKSVLIYSDPDLQILFSHPFRGVFHKNLSKNTPWKEINTGLHKYSGVYEEVSDLTVNKTPDGRQQILASHNFAPQILALNPKTLKWESLFKMKEDFAVMESLYLKDGKILFVSHTGLMEYDPESKALNRIHLEKMLKSFEEKSGVRIQSLSLVKDEKQEYRLSDLWLLSEKLPKPNMELASGKKGIYIQADKARNKKQLREIRDLMGNMDYNMLVIDMKDDFGELRYQPENPVVLKYGKVFNPLNLKEFVPYMKEKNIFLVARIVVFKDKALYHYNQGQFAVKDSMTGAPWRGMVKTESGAIKMNSEHWVDPYSEKVWEYNIEVAKELIALGFDEVQFDYIRFPTDGENLHQTRYPYQDEGMDKESALISFLSFARENITAPISVDIYGANGWHRTGARTGQDVELLQKYVDVICPMYYPSHFTQNFLDFPPAEKRTWRIYYYGSFRNYYMARKNAVIRPYLQAFKMNRSYDNAYYGPQYIRNQVRGVEQSIDMGYTFWNSGSRYSILLESFGEKKISFNKTE